MPEPDQRAVRRLEAKAAAATVQTLGTSAGANGPVRAVTVVDVSERGMRLRSAAPMNAGEAVKIEMGDTMFLGEVCYCAPVSSEADRSFYLGIVTRECLTGLASLHHLIRALSQEPVRELECLTVSGILAENTP